MLSELSFGRIRRVNLFLLMLIFGLAVIPMENESVMVTHEQAGQEDKPTVSLVEHSLHDQVKQQGSQTKQLSNAVPSMSMEKNNLSRTMETFTQGKEDRVQTSLESILHIHPSDFNTMEVTATGYYAGPESTGKSVGHPEYGITYSGVRVRRATVSTIAADPTVLPIGSLLYIPNYGYGVVADTGSAIKGKKIDLYFETKQDVYNQWGKRKVKVLVLKKGSGKVTESMLNQWNQAFAQLKNDPAVM